jgi:parafibromin
MATTADPLLMLRQTVSNQQQPTLHSSKDPSTPALSADSLSQATHLYFPVSQAVLPLDTPTRFKRQGIEPLIFSLREIFFAWILQAEKTADYIAKCQEQGIHNLTFLEKADLSTFLEGGEASDSIGMLLIFQLIVVNDEISTAVPEDATSIPAKPTSTIKGRSEAVLKIHASERTIKSRMTVLRGTKPTDFSSLSVAAKQYFFSRLRNVPSVTPTAATKNRDPIILLSPSASSLITMHNVKMFLEEGKFIPPAVAAQEAGGGRGPELLHISHKSSRFGGRPTRYVVVEGTEKFKPDYWDRVVCVFTTGQVWQFREYLYSQPRTLFQHVHGVFVAYSTDPLNPVQKEWNIATIKVEPNKRHTDKEVVRNFWDGLEKWMEARGKLRK